MVLGQYGAELVVVVVVIVVVVIVVVVVVGCYLVVLGHCNLVLRILTGIGLVQRFYACIY